MNILFKDQAIRLTCEKRAVATKALGDIGARKLAARLSEIEAATYVTDLVIGNPHPLKGDRLGQFALSLAGGWRLVFVPANDPVPLREDESILWSQVTIVCIEFIGDYHD